jgi:membrane protease YdiL (CAAX protease family)
MDFIRKDKEENSAYVQLLILAGYTLAGVILTTVLGFVILIAMYGMGVISNPNNLMGENSKYLDGLKIFQIVVSIGMFLLPPLFLAITERQKISEFYGFKKPVLVLLVLVFLAMLFSMPIMEYSAILNQKMHLPEWLKPLEQWMREKEDLAARTTVMLLTVRQPYDFVVNLIMIAIVPAIAEELMFRGGVQRSLMKMFNNPHVAIWITAIIFSAIHMQFFGFFPRMFLGALFGYIYVWTKSLWYTIFAHFLNNGYAVCMALYMQKHNMPLDAADNSSNFPWYGYLLSFIFTALLLVYFKKHTSANGKQLD